MAAISRPRNRRPMWHASPGNWDARRPDWSHRPRPKLLLRGRVGYVHSIVWPRNKKLPEVVFVQFLDADWQLMGTKRPGIYPIQPVRRVWYIDAGKPKPVLKVTRQQLPLCPAFCITAHTSQGKTLPAAILDMCVDKKIDVTFGTVTASRVRSRHDVLIFRPFPLWLYQRGVHLPNINTGPPPPKKKKPSCKEPAGPPPGVALLLEQLRGEHINWEEYRQSQRPTATCRDCNDIRGFEQFFRSGVGSSPSKPTSNLLHLS